MINKIVIVGNYKWDFYEDALLQGFKAIGVEAHRYKLTSTSFNEKIFNFKKINQINKLFFKEMLLVKPNVIFMYRTNELKPNTIRKLKTELPETKLIIFHNDNPFHGLKNRIKYHYFLKCIKEVDLTYVYRPSNIKDAKKFEAKEVQLFYPYFYSKIHLNNEIDFKQKKYNIIFIGHYEQNRAKYIDYLEKRDYEVVIFGTGWEKIAKKLKWSKVILGGPLYGDNYNRTIIKSKIALCFLSHKNKDVYTRRNFEITAIGTLVLSEYSKELSEMFIPDNEIVLFRNERELIDKIDLLLRDSKLIKEITLAGHKKIINEGNSEMDRAKQIIDDINVFNS